MEEVRNYGKIVFIKSIVEKGRPPLDPPLTHVVTVGTEIAAPHKQQVTVAAVSCVFIKISRNIVYDATNKFQ